MQKIERHTSAKKERKPIVPLISFALVPSFAILPVFVLVRFGERSLSFFVAVDCVTVLVLLVVYKVMQRRAQFTFLSVQLAAGAIFVLATVQFLQYAPSYDTFFGIPDAESAYLPIALFALTILCVPLLVVQKLTVRVFFGVLFALPVLMLPSAVLDGGSTATAFVGMLTLFVGAFALPLYTMSKRNFSIASFVATASLVHIGYGAGALPHSILLVLLIASLVFFARMLLELHYAARANHIAARLTRNAALRARGVFAFATALLILAQNGQLYALALAGGAKQLFTQELSTLALLLQNAEQFEAPSGTLALWLQHLGTLGALTFLALVGAAIYMTQRALREPEFYEKSWYTLVQVTAAGVGMGTLAALLMPLGSGSVLLVGVLYEFLCVGVAKISPERAWFMTTTKRVFLRRAGAPMLALCVALVWYYTVRYAFATRAASKSAWQEAYQSMPSPHYLAGALETEAAEFRSQLTVANDAEVALDLARTVTTHIVEARKKYPDNTEIAQAALTHYEFLTQLGVKGAVDETIAILEKLYAQNPDAPLLTLRYATALLEASRAQEARDILDTSSSRMTSDTQMQYTTLYAYVLMALEDYAGAAALFAEVVKTGSRDSGTYLAYGISQVHTDVPAARRILAEALAKFPSDASVYVYAALTEQIAGDRNAARAVLEKGIRRATSGDTAILRTLLDELTQKGSISSIGIANIPVPEPLSLDISTTTATSTHDQ